MRIEMEAIGRAEAARAHADPFAPETLEKIEAFSHAEVLFFFDRVDPARVVSGARHPRNNPDWPAIGIFAQRGKNRPNRIGSTICRVVRRAGRRLFVAELDAIDGTPVLDIKPLLAEFRPREPVVQPAWSCELMRDYWQKKDPAGSWVHKSSRIEGTLGGKETPPMKILGIILALLVAGVAVFAVVAALQPAEFRIERSVTIAVPPAVVFAKVNDLHGFQEFSPWAKRDPAAKNTFEGPSAGEGASFAWAGNAEIGEGRMTIVESRPDERVRIRLEFLKPFASNASTEFAFKPEGDGTVVTWSMTGQNDFTGKAMGLIMNMDEMIGRDFEAGLASLKSLSESGRVG